MLAGLLLNLAVGRKYPSDGMVNGKYLMVQGTYVDTEERPDPATVKKVVRAIRRIKLPKADRRRAEGLIVQAQRFTKGAKPSMRADTAAMDVLAYRNLIELFKRNVRETEEAALLLLLLEL